MKTTNSLKTTMVTIGLVVLGNLQVGFAQPVENGQQRIDAKIPDVVLHLYDQQVIKEGSLSDFEDKPIILDFWDVSCGACVKAMLHMYYLQNTFKDQLKIIVVTSDDSSAIQQLWRKLAQVHSAHVDSLLFAARHLTFAINNVAFAEFKPRQILPKHMWIDTGLIFKSLAYVNSTTEGNIRLFLAHRPVDYALIGQQGDIDIFDPATWFTKKDSSINGRPRVSAYSVLTERMELGNGDMGVAPIIVKDSVTKKTIAISAYNMTIVELYKIVYQRLLQEVEVKSNRFSFEGYDMKFFYSDWDDQAWIDKHTYCYALKRTGAKDDQEFYQMMKKDLDDFFKLRSRMAVKRVKCLVLKQVSPVKWQSGNHEPGEIKQVFDSVGSCYLEGHAVYVAYLFVMLENGYMQWYDRFCPVINEVKNTKLMDFRIVWSDHQIDKTLPLETLRRSLRQNGFDLVEEYRELPMIVLSPTD